MRLNPPPVSTPGLAPARRARAPRTACLLRLLVCLVPLAASHAAPLEVVVTDSAGKPLPGAAVFLESREARAAVRPVNTIEIVQNARQFSPIVTVVPVGSAVSFPNRDSVRHHLYSFSPAKKFEIKLYVGTPAAPVVFDQSGIAALGCNIHDNMAAWVVVVDTPHHGLTGADGRFHLAQVPPGSYRLRTWHPTLPPGAPALDQALQVGASGGPAVNVRLVGPAL